MYALTYSGLLVILGAASTVTDMPGYYYVPAQFSLVTMAFVLLFTLAQLAIALWGYLINRLTRKGR